MLDTTQPLGQLIVKLFVLTLGISALAVVARIGWEFGGKLYGMF